jgi:hypothetical protein
MGGGLSSFDWTAALVFFDLGFLGCFGRLVAWGLSTVDEETGSFRFGLPTFFCSPRLQITSASVHRTHRRSSGLMRLHLALFFLHNWHEKRRCDGWTSISLFV